MAVQEFVRVIDTIDEVVLVEVWNKWFERMAKCVAAQGGFIMGW